MTLETSSRRLEGKNVVVTGGSSGNGRAIAMEFAANGANIVIADVTDRPREGGPPTAEWCISQHGVQAEFVRCDVRVREDQDRAVAACGTWGGIDIMVANAGVLRKNGLMDLNDETYQQMMDVNVKGVLWSAQAAAAQMVPKGSGCIIAISSIAGLRGTASYAAYNMSKGAVRLLASSLAHELGPLGIRVNAICPGLIETQMIVADDPVVGTEEESKLLDQIPLGRFGQPQDVARLATFLASDDASYIAGSSLVVDGGYLRI